MATALQLFLILFMMVATVLGGGLVLVRKLDCSPLNRLCLGIALGLGNVYLVAMLTYVMNWPLWVMHGTGALFVIFSVLRFRQLRSLLSDPYCVAALQGFGVLLLVVLALTGSISSFSGGGSYGDYFEHYHRAIFFLERLPLDSEFLGLYSLPARPPMYNLVCGFFMAIAGKDFFSFQWTSAILNSLAFFSACLALKQLGLGPGKLRFLPLLLLLNPFFVHNASYPWSKMLTVFFVILAMLWYFSYVQQRQTRSLLIAVALMTLGFLCHYSAGPFALFMVLHYLVISVPTLTRRVPEMGLACGVGLGLLATWFGWSFMAYGVSETLASNTAVSDAVQLGAMENLQKVLANIRDTLLPHPLHGAPLELIEQTSRWGYLRDYLFLIYQTNLIFGIGSLTGLLLLANLKGYLRDVAQRSTVRFWFAFALFTVIVGIAVHGTPSAYGLAHIGLQPLVLMGLVLVIAIGDRLSKRLRWVAAVGLLADLVLGVVLHFVVQARSGGLSAVDWPYSRTAFFNLQLKQGYYLEFLADAVPLAAWMAMLLVGLILTGGLVLRPSAKLVHH